MEGVEVGKAVAGNPVVKMAKKHPIIAVGIVGGGVLLAYMFKPAASTQDPALVGDTSGYYPDTTAPAAGGGGVDTAGIMDAVAGMLDAQGKSSSDALDTFAAQYASDMSGFENSLTDQLNSALASMQPTAGALAPAAAVAGPLEDIPAKYSALPSIQRVDLASVATPATVAPLTIMDQLGAKWGEIYKATGLMDTPEQNQLHGQAQEIGASIGLNYNSETGTYHQAVNSPVTQISQPASKPASGIGSNQYLYLQNLAGQGGGSAIWANAELAAGRY